MNKVELKKSEAIRHNKYELFEFYGAFPDSAQDKTIGKKIRKGSQRDESNRSIVKEEIGVEYLDSLFPEVFKASRSNYNLYSELNLLARGDSAEIPLPIISMRLFHWALHYSNSLPASHWYVISVNDKFTKFLSKGLGFELCGEKKKLKGNPGVFAQPLAFDLKAFSAGKLEPTALLRQPRGTLKKIARLFSKQAKQIGEHEDIAESVRQLQNYNLKIFWTDIPINPTDPDSPLRGDYACLAQMKFSII